MNVEEEIIEIDSLFQDFLVLASPYLSGENKKQVLKHLNKQFQSVSDGKAKNLIKRVEKEFGVSLEEQFKAIEISERGRWGIKHSKKV